MPPRSCRFVCHYRRRGSVAASWRSPDVARHDKLSSTSPLPLVIPLVIPGEGQLTSNELTVTTKTGISATYPSGPWIEEPRSKADAGAIALSVRCAIGDVTLSVVTKEQSQTGTTTIERAWIQTWLTAAQRQDRAVYRLSTREPHVEIALPVGADLESIEIELDSRRVAPEAVRQQNVVIALPSGPRVEHVLELRYHFAGRPALGSLALDCPRFKAAVWIQQLYWQLVVPVDEHLVFASDRFTCELRWSFNGLFWQRQPLLEQRDLEGWVGGPTAAELAVRRRGVAREARVASATRRTGDESLFVQHRGRRRAARALHARSRAVSDARLAAGPGLGAGHDLLSAHAPSGRIVRVGGHAGGRRLNGSGECGADRSGIDSGAGDVGNRRAAGPRFDPSAGAQHGGRAWQFAGAGRAERVAAVSARRGRGRAAIDRYQPARAHPFRRSRVMSGVRAATILAFILFVFVASPATGGDQQAAQRCRRPRCRDFVAFCCRPMRSRIARGPTPICRSMPPNSIACSIA